MYIQHHPYVSPHLSWRSELQQQRWSALHKMQQLSCTEHCSEPSPPCFTRLNIRILLAHPSPSSPGCPEAFAEVRDLWTAQHIPNPDPASNHSISNCPEWGAPGYRPATLSTCSPQAPAPNRTKPSAASGASGPAPPSLGTAGRRRRRKTELPSSPFRHHTGQLG